MKKKIAIIRNAKAYDFGGGERFPVFLADILQKNEWEPLIVSRSPKLLSFAKDHSLFTVKGWWWSYQNWSGKFALLFPVYLVWQLVLFFWYLQLFVRLKPSAIHIQSKDDFIAATFVGKLLSKRVIWTDHADLKHIWLNVDVWYKNPVGKFVYLAALKADAITVVSKSELKLVKENLKEGSIVSKKLKVIYNGVVDTQNLPKQHKKNSPTTTFCMANRLVTDKGIGEAIEAFSKLEKVHPDIELILIGNGPEEQYFREKAKDHSKITFLGYQKNPLTYIATADILMQPTYHEGFSVTLVEASMLARPIIATGVGGNLEIIKNEETGLLIPPKDANALYKAMLRLLEDKKLQQILGEAARKQYLERFDFNRITTEQFIPLYEGGNV